MRIQFKYGSKAVPISVVSDVLKTFSKPEDGIHSSSMDIYLRFSDEDGVPQDYVFVDDKGKEYDEMVIVSPKELKKKPKNTIQHISASAKNDEYPGYELYITMKD